MYPMLYQQRFHGSSPGRARSFQPNSQQYYQPVALPVYPGRDNVANMQAKLPTWPPDHVLPNYNGPYPRRELEEARFSLIDSLIRDSSMVLQRVKPMLGISSMCGPAYLPPHPPQSQMGSGQQRLMHTSDSYSFPALQYNNKSFETGSKLQPEISAPAVHSGQQLSSNNVSLTSVDSGISEDASHLDDTVTMSEGDIYDHGDASIFDSPMAAGVQKGRFQQRHSTPQPSRTVTATVTSPGQQANIEALVRTSTPIQRKRTMDSGDAPEEGKRNKFTLEPGPLGKTVGQVFQIYKCDMCKFNAKEKEELNYHLENAKHVSGSLYNTDGKELLSVEEMMVVKNIHNKTKSLIVACPDCHDIFDDIFMCAMHHKYEHHSTNGLYSVCPITNHETVSFHVDPRCKTCGTVFGTHRELHQHWAGNSDHHPLKEPTNPRMFAIYICPYCSKIFYNNFLLCKTHVLSHQSMLGYDKKVLALEVKHILQPMHSDELPPFNTAPGHENGLEIELRILTSLQNYYRKAISGANLKQKQLTPRIRNLKKLLGKDREQYI